MSLPQKVEAKSSSGLAVQNTPSASGRHRLSFKQPSLGIIHNLTTESNPLNRSSHLPLTCITMGDSSFQLSPAAVAIPVLSIITLVLCFPPFVWHVRHRNIAASSLVFWIVLDNIFNFINALIWPTDNIASWWNGNGLCDIEVKLMAAATVGLNGSMACIMRNLAQVMNTKSTVLEPSGARRRREMVINLLFCFGCPIYLMVIHYVVQPNRYYLFAISGCTTSYDNSWPSIVLVFIWPPILCILATYYASKQTLFLYWLEILTNPFTLKF